MPDSIIDFNTYPSTAYQGYYSWQLNLKAVYYGPGCVNEALPELLKTLGIKRALVLTSKSVFHKTDICKRIEDILRKHDAYQVTSYHIEQHTPISAVQHGMKLFDDNGCDGIVAVGGGSCIDAAKAMMYLYQKSKGGPTPFQIAIPTTLSAAEYQLGAGYVDEEGEKVAVSSPDIVPGGIILDAELTLNTPERLWLSTGIKALDHAVEDLYREKVTPPVKVLACHAISELFKYLPLSKANPESIEIRQKLQLASWMSLWPMKQNKYVALGISHSLGHKLAKYNIPHGFTSCLALGPSVKLQAEVATDEKKETLAEVLFYLRQPSTGSVEGDVLNLSERIDKLIRDLGLHSTLSEYGVPREDLRELAGQALGGGNHPHVEKVVQMLESMYE